MFALTTLFLSALLLIARADPNPTEPGNGETFKEGSTCHIAWDADTTGKWKTMNIQLMTGDNFNMVPLTTVATVDGTDTTKTTYDYPCPSVTPNSGIYFYQFTASGVPGKYWTTRFTIADANGNTTPPTEAKQPDGENIPWGTGALASASSSSPQSSSSGAPASSAVPSSSISSSAISTSSPAPSSANSAPGSSPSPTLAPASGAPPADASSPSRSIATVTTKVGSASLPGAAAPTQPANNSPNGATATSFFNVHTLALTLSAYALIYLF